MYSQTEKGYVYQVCPAGSISPSQMQPIVPFFCFILNPSASELTVFICLAVVKAKTIHLLSLTPHGSHASRL